MSRLQQNWDLRAAANFMFGGTGSALVLFSAFASGNHELLLGMTLIATGLGAVWLEIGRKLRAVHVLLNPFTSWMTRESFAAVLVFGFGIGFVLSDQTVLKQLAAISALLFLWCQARILHASKGIPAWRAPEVVPLIVATGLAEGSGLALLFATDTVLLILFSLAVIARFFAWKGYRAAVRSAALKPAGLWLRYVGTAGALLLAFATLYTDAAAPLAAACALAAGWRFKLDLVTRAAFKQEFTLPRLPVRGTR